jgi:hypothetical protein
VLPRWGAAVLRPYKDGGFRAGNILAQKAKRPDSVEAYFSARISVPYYKILSREIFDFFRPILTPFVFKSIVASITLERSPRRRPPCHIFVTRSVIPRKPGPD